MDADEKDSYERAGSIARDVREYSKKLVVEGAKFIDVAEGVEERIVKLGGGIAFPTNICVNDVTAHYTPKFNDDSVVGKDDVVTIDLGVHFDGFIGDTAYTVDLSGKYKDLLKVNMEALEKAIELVKPGVSEGEKGRAE